jgi:hypothetical protein
LIIQIVRAHRVKICVRCLDIKWFGVIKHGGSEFIVSYWHCLVSWLFSGRSQLWFTPPWLVAGVPHMVFPSDDIECPVTAYWGCSYVAKICCTFLALWYQNHTSLWLNQ